MNKILYHKNGGNYIYDIYFFNVVSCNIFVTQNSDHPIYNNIIFTDVDRSLELPALLYTDTSKTLKCPQSSNPTL